MREEHRRSKEAAALSALRVRGLGVEGPKQTKFPFSLPVALVSGINSTQLVDPH